MVANIEHPAEIISQFPDTISQFKMREETILQYLADKGYSISDFSAITGRGGMISL